MRKRGVYLILGVLAVGGVLVAVFARREREPAYGGKRLSEWVETFTDTESEAKAVEVMRVFGTNSLPYLVKWISYEPPTWKMRFYDFVNPVARGLKASWELTDDK